MTHEQLVGPMPSPFPSRLRDATWTTPQDEGILGRRLAAAVGALVVAAGIYTGVTSGWPLTIVGGGLVLAGVLSGFFLGRAVLRRPGNTASAGAQTRVTDGPEREELGPQLAAAGRTISDLLTELGRQRDAAVGWEKRCRLAAAEHTIALSRLQGKLMAAERELEAVRDPQYELDRCRVALREEVREVLAVPLKGVIKAARTLLADQDVSRAARDTTLFIESETSKLLERLEGLEGAVAP
jgi:hypothetical protein